MLPSSQTLQIPGIHHVILVLLENQPYNNVAGNYLQAPYQNQIARSYALAANYYSVEHPSLPNYIDLIAGSDFGISTNCPPSPRCQVNGTNTNITNLITSKGLSWKEYAESMPAPCYKLDAGEYEVGHNPFVYFQDVTGSLDYCNQHVIPFGNSTQGFYADLESGKLPNYSFVTPNVCNDGDRLCNKATSRVAEADAWLSGFMNRVVMSPEYNSTVLFVVYDEGDPQFEHSQVYCAVVSPFVSKGYVSLTRYTHFSLLATVELIFGLGSLQRNDSVATTMADMLNGSSTKVVTTSTSSSVSAAFTLNQVVLALALVSIVGGISVYLVVRRRPDREMVPMTG